MPRLRCVRFPTLLTLRRAERRGNNRLARWIRCRSYCHSPDHPDPVHAAGFITHELDRLAWIRTIGDNDTIASVETDGRR